jgi:hypothetical protein
MSAKLYESSIASPSGALRAKAIALLAMSSARRGGKFEPGYQVALAGMPPP